MGAETSPRSSLPAGLRAFCGRCRAFGRSQDGATAVEFALIALPFFGLLFVTLQIAMVLWCTSILEVAVASASRQLYTGQFQSSATNSGLTASALQANFKKLVCAAASDAFNCSASLSVDVQTFAGFPTATVASPNNNGVYDTTGYSYQTPARNDIVVVRASMEFPNYASYFMPKTALLNGKQLIMATAAFRAEPF